MPWHLTAKKDVVSCEKPWGAAKRAMIHGYLNGETRWVEGPSPQSEYIALRGGRGELKHLSTRRRRNQKRLPQ